MISWDASSRLRKVELDRQRGPAMQRPACAARRCASRGWSPTDVLMDYSMHVGADKLVDVRCLAAGRQDRPHSSRSISYQTQKRLADRRNTPR
jgi:hypothetical protein